jgi:MFS family permease
MPQSARRWGTLTGVSLASFMTFLDNNVVNVALPTIQRDLHLSISGLEWIASCWSAAAFRTSTAGAGCS